MGRLNRIRTLQNCCRSNPQVLADDPEPLEVSNDVVLFFSGDSVKQVQDNGKHTSLPESATLRSGLLQKMIKEATSGTTPISLSEDEFQSWLSFLTGPDSQTKQHATREKLIQVLQVTFRFIFCMSWKV